jgi:putative acetyltransferase
MIEVRRVFTMIIIQSEKKEHYNAIYEINVLAFGRKNEARLVEKLRETSNFNPGLSLVALKDGKIVGHILFSPIAIQTNESTFPGLSLAPMAVHPEFQHQGIGSGLMYNGLECCRNHGHKIIIVIGHPEYYPRFGFISARGKGLEAAFPVPDEAFMALELVPGALNGMRGMVIYPPAFLNV